MKFLMYSESGEGAQLLKRIQDEGNEVALYIDDKVYKNTFDGILHKVTTPEEFIDKNTTIIFDLSGFGEKADEYRKQGYNVYGASGFADKLEKDRNFGFSIMEQSGIKIPSFKEFTDYKSGIEYAESCGKRLVFKPNGTMPCKLTYVSDSPEQLVEYLKFIEKRFAKNIDSYILQEFIEGIVVSSEMFVSCGELLLPFNHTVEVKKSMNDDLGPSTGCSGNITWNGMTKIHEQGVFKANKVLKDEEYTGQIDLNAVVNEDGIYGLEWTPRFGYDATPTYMTLLDMEMGEFFYKAARGENIPVVSKTSDYAGSIRLSIPPYPMEVKRGLDTEKVSPNEGIPIQGWEKHQGEIYFYEVMLSDGVLVHSGGTGVIGIAIGVNEDCDKCLDRPYEILKGIKVPDKQYRTDLVKTLTEMVDEVEEYAQ